MRRHLCPTLGAQPYVYDTISTPETIRLLRLDNENNGIISGHLLTTSFADAPPYFALSYSWGMHKKNVAISWDGRKLCVTASLDQALRLLQGLSNEASKWGFVSNWFWIDQICIYSDRTRIKTRRNLRLGTSIFLRGLINVPDREMCSPRFEIENTWLCSTVHRPTRPIASVH
jgi:hypothetical protein